MGQAATLCAYATDDHPAFDHLVGSVGCDDGEGSQAVKVSRVVANDGWGMMQSYNGAEGLTTVMCFYLLIGLI